jgi:hypothetical protein
MGIFSYWWLILLRLEGLNGKSVRFGLNDQAPDADTVVKPLTAISPKTRQIADHLVGPGETLRLVIGSHRSGPFRRSFAFWVTDNSIEPLQNDLRLLRHGVRRASVWSGAMPRLAWAAVA